MRFPRRRLLGARSWHGELTYDGIHDDVTLTGLDTGDGFHIAVDGSEILGLDLSSERVHVTANEGGGVLVEVAPSFDAAMSTRFESVAGRFEEPLPAWLANDDLTLRLEGDPSASVLLKEDAAATSGPDPLPMMPARLLQVVSGRLTLTSRVGSHSVEVDSGMCLVSTDAADTAHPLEQVAAGTCE